MRHVLIIEMDKKICHALKEAALATETGATFLCPEDLKAKPAAQWVRSRNQKVDAIVISEFVPEVSTNWVVSVITDFRLAGLELPMVATSCDPFLEALYVRAGATAFVHRTVELNAAGGLYKALELLDAKPKQE